MSGTLLTLLLGLKPFYTRLPAHTHNRLADNLVHKVMCLLKVKRPFVSFSSLVPRASIRGARPGRPLAPSPPACVRPPTSPASRSSRAAAAV